MRVVPAPADAHGGLPAPSSDTPRWSRWLVAISGVRVASIDRTAYPRFARAVSARELAEVFTPSVVEVEWARGKTQDDQHLLALLVWLKAYQRLGYFPEAQRRPCSALRAHPRGDRPAGGGAGGCRGAVGQAASVVRAHADGRHLRRGQGAGGSRQGDPEGGPGEGQQDNPADLINVALEELVRAECELPGYTTLDEMTKKIRTEVNRGFFTLVSGRVDAGARARLARLLLVDPITRRSEYDGLKDVAQAASLNKFKGRLAFLHELDGLGPTEVWLEGVPPGKIARFAGEARVTDSLTCGRCWMRTSASR